MDNEFVKNMEPTKGRRHIMEDFSFGGRRGVRMCPDKQSLVCEQGKCSMCGVVKRICRAPQMICCEEYEIKFCEQCVLSAFAGADE